MEVIVIVGFFSHIIHALSALLHYHHFPCVVALLDLVGLTNTDEKPSPVCHLFCLTRTETPFLPAPIPRSQSCILIQAFPTDILRRARLQHEKPDGVRALRHHCQGVRVGSTCGPLRGALSVLAACWIVGVGRNLPVGSAILL